MQRFNPVYSDNADLKLELINERAQRMKDRADMQNELTLLQEHNKQLQIKNANLNAALQEANQSKRMANNQKFDVFFMVSNLTEQNENLKNELNHVRENLANLQIQREEEISRIHMNFKEIQQVRDQLYGQIEFYKKRLEESCAANQAYRMANTHLVEVKHSLLQKIEEYSVLLAKANRELASVHDRNQYLFAQNAYLAERIFITQSLEEIGLGSVADLLQSKENRKFTEKLIQTLKEEKTNTEATTPNNSESEFRLSSSSTILLNNFNNTTSTGQEIQPSPTVYPQHKGPA